MDALKFKAVAAELAQCAVNSGNTGFTAAMVLKNDAEKDKHLAFLEALGCDKFDDVAKAFFDKNYFCTSVISMQVLILDVIREGVKRKTVTGTLVDGVQIIFEPINVLDEDGKSLFVLDASPTVGLKNLTVMEDLDPEERLSTSTTLISTNCKIGDICTATFKKQKSGYVANALVPKSTEAKREANATKLETLNQREHAQKIELATIANQNLIIQGQQKAEVVAVQNTQTFRLELLGIAKEGMRTIQAVMGVQPVNDAPKQHVPNEADGVGGKKEKVSEDITDFDF